jgi:predicted exporter
VLAAAVAAREIAGADLACDLLPSAATQAARRALLPDAPTLRASLAAALEGLPFRADAFAPFLHDVEAARAAPPVTADTLSGTALGLRIGALLGRDADGPYAVVPLRGVESPTAMAARIAGAADPAIAWLDLRTASTALLAAYRHQALVATGGGVVLIGLLLVVGLRDVRRALGVLLPVLAATVGAAALLVASGTALTLFHLVALLLVVGIGVNYGLFADRAHAVAGEGARVVRTLLVVSATTLCAFATLAVSGIPVLHALGATVCTGVLACLAAVALVHAPAS